MVDRREFLKFGLAAAAAVPAGSNAQVIEPNPATPGPGVAPTPLPMLIA